MQEKKKCYFSLYFDTFSKGEINFMSLQFNLLHLHLLCSVFNIEALSSGTLWENNTFKISESNSSFTSI